MDFGSFALEVQDQLRLIQMVRPQTFGQLLIMYSTLPLVFAIFLVTLFPNTKFKLIFGNTRLILRFIDALLLSYLLALISIILHVAAFLISIAI